jgi:hypothetical protein
VELFARIHTHGSAVTLGSSTAAINLHTETAVIDTTNGEDPLFVNGATITLAGPVEGTSPTGGEGIDLNAGNAGDVVFAPMLAALVPSAQCWFATLATSYSRTSPANASCS